MTQNLISSLPASLTRHCWLAGRSGIIWSTDNGDEAFMGEILGVKTAHGTSEFEILYDEHEERIFMEFDEVLTDLKCGDLQIM